MASKNILRNSCLVKKEIYILATVFDKKEKNPLEHVYQHILDLVFKQSLLLDLFDLLMIIIVYLMKKKRLLTAND